MKDKHKSAGRGLAWFAVGLVVFAIFCLSAQPHSAAFTYRLFGDYNSIVRPLAHMVEFAVFFLALRWALGKTLTRASVLSIYMIAISVCAGYAFVDEWHQSFVPGRTAALEHVVNDLIGVGIAAFVCACLDVGRRLLGRKQ